MIVICQLVSYCPEHHIAHPGLTGLPSADFTRFRSPGSKMAEDIPVAIRFRLISYCPKLCISHPDLAGMQLVKEPF